MEKDGFEMNDRMKMNGMRSVKRYIPLPKACYKLVLMTRYRKHLKALRPSSDTFLAFALGKDDVLCILLNAKLCAQSDAIFSRVLYTNPALYSLNPSGNAFVDDRTKV